MQFEDGVNRQTLALTGEEIVDISLPEGVTEITPRQELTVTISRADGDTSSFAALSRLDTENEIAYFKSGGILQYVLNNLVGDAA